MNNASNSPVLDLDRRSFVKILSAGLMVAISSSALAAPEAESKPAPHPEAHPEPPREEHPRPRGPDIAARVHIAKDGAITVMTGKVECGQGARGELTQAAAEELCVPPHRITLLMGDTSLCPDDGGTFGSQTTPRSVPAVRQGCAIAREMMVAVLCRKWDCGPAEVEIRDGTIRHPESGRQMSYAEIVATDPDHLFDQPLPRGVRITPVTEWQVMGTDFPRPNDRDLITGQHDYPSNIVRDGMLHGLVLRPPSYYARLKKIDTDAAKSINGAMVIRDGEFVGVAAPTRHTARKALDLVSKTAEWIERKNQVASKDLYAHLRSTARNIPDNPHAGTLSAAAHAVKAEYRIPYVQHAPMEPHAAVAEWSDEWEGTLTVATATQNPWGVRAELMRTFKLPAERVRVIVPDFGGGFGGKHTGECAIEAARLAKGAGKPVLVRWTREEEFTWAYFRPASVMLAEAAIDAQGKLQSWYFVNINAGGAGIDTPYKVPGKLVRAVYADSPLRVGSYRGLGATASHFARESIMDELAAAAVIDPLTFRLNNLDNPRLIAVLKRAADTFGFVDLWRQKRPNLGVGLACGTEKGSYVAACAEVAINPATRQLSVNRVCQAFECGKIVNPANLLSQVQGALIMGMGPALREAIAFDNGAITNGTFTDYKVPRFSDLPALDIQLIDRPDLPSAGAGETPIMAIAPAIGNGVFHATGTRLRELPLRLPG